MHMPIWGGGGEGGVIFLLFFFLILSNFGKAKYFMNSSHKKTMATSKHALVD